MSEPTIPTPEEMAAMSKLFAALDGSNRARLLARAERRQAQPGDVLCREGERGEEFYVVLGGKFAVQADDFGTARHVATLTRGAFFGEMALLADQPRSATVVATEPGEVLAFGRAAVDEVLQSQPKIREALGKVGLQRAEQLIEKLSS